MPSAFNPEFINWKQMLFESAGSANAPVRQLGDHVLRLFFHEGCEPTMTALLDYAQAGLSKRYNIRASDRSDDQSDARSDSVDPARP
jgi:hypothetical protein